MPWCGISSSGPKFPGWWFTGTYRRWSKKKENLLDKNDNQNILNSDVIFWRFFPTERKKKLPEAKFDWQAGLTNTRQIACKADREVVFANYLRKHFN